jgi:hypothetical protein
MGKPPAPSVHMARFRPSIGRFVVRYYSVRHASSCGATKLGALRCVGIAWLLVLHLVCSAPALSSEPTQATNPSQEQPAPVLRVDQSEAEKSQHLILSAKTVCVVGELGAVTDKPQDWPNPASAKKQVEKVIRKWGRFALVQDSEQADLVLVVVVGTEEDVDWSEDPPKDKTYLVDRLLVFKGGKIPREDLFRLRMAYMVDYGITVKDWRVRVVPPVDATLPLLWDSGEPRSSGYWVAVKFRKFVQRLEKRKHK